MDTYQFRGQKSKYLEKKVKNNYKKVLLYDCILRVSEPKAFVFIKDNIPQEMWDFFEARRKRWPKSRIMRECIDFHDYTFRYTMRATTNTLKDINTELVIIKFLPIREFYQEFKGNWYGCRYKVNAKRMRDIEAIDFDVVEQIINCCSAGLWELKKERYSKGFTMIQHTLNFPSPMEVIKTNLHITHNIGLLTMLNSGYRHRDVYR